MSKADRTRHFIIEQVAPIFNRKGYAGTSLSDMTEATGLTKGAIYGNFSNKDEVALAAFDYNFQRIVEAITSEMSRAHTNLERLLVYPSFYRKALERGGFYDGCPIANTATEADDTHPALRQRVVAALNRWQRHLLRLIEMGQAAGEIKPSVSPSGYAALIMSLIEGGIVLSKATGDLQFLHQAVDRVERLITDELASQTCS